MPWHKLTIELWKMLGAESSEKSRDNTWSSVREAWRWLNAVKLLPSGWMDSTSLFHREEKAGSSLTPVWPNQHSYNWKLFLTSYKSHQNNFKFKETSYVKLMSKTWEVSCVHLLLISFFLVTIISSPLTILNKPVYARGKTWHPWNPQKLLVCQKYKYLDLVYITSKICLSYLKGYF